MYFCNECNYSYDIGKSTNLETDTKTVIKKIPDIYKKVENKEDLKDYKTDIKIDDIIKNSKYKDLDDAQKKNINKLYEESNNSGINFKCTNCGHSKEIKESVLLYNLDLNNKVEKIKTLEENMFICKNPILPRTHDYICKNDKCDTFKKNINKEAVFYRETNSMRINYICCVCYYSW